MKIKKLTFSAMLLGFSLIIFIVESYLPPLAPVPGIKIGLANVITLIAVYMLGRKEAFVILVLRIVLGSIYSGNAVGFVYSLAGGISAFLAMSASAVFIKENMMWVTSVFGAMGHNIGQIAAACAVMRTLYIAWYLPVLLISAVITGTFTGVAAQITLRRLRRTNILESGKDA